MGDVHRPRQRRHGIEGVEAAGRRRDVEGLPPALAEVGELGRFASSSARTCCGTIEVACSMAVDATRSEKKTGTSVAPRMTATISPITRPRRFGACGARPICTTTGAANACVMSWVSPQNGQVSDVEPAGGSFSVAPQPWQRLAVGTPRFYLGGAVYSGGSGCLRMAAAAR
jgi:hypothetical protein